MTRIDFYQISNPAYTEESLACILCHKAFEAKQKTLLLTADPEQTSRLDRQLWTSDDSGFLPHDCEEQPDFTTPLLVTHQADPRGERELLINLSGEVPQYFAQFERVIEIVTDNNRDQARRHYSHYKDLGFPLNHHSL